MAHAMALTASASFQLPRAELVVRPNLQSYILSQLTSCHIVPLLVVHLVHLQMSMQLVN